MTSKTGSARAATLALERLTETAIIDGDVVDIPHREFALLIELAARPGEAVHGKKLIATIWPDTAGMTPQDLYVLMSKLRKRIGDNERGKDKLIRTLSGFRYFLALPAEKVLIADDLGDASANQVIHLDGPDEELGKEATSEEVPAPHQPTAPLSQERPATRANHLARAVLAAALLIVAVGGSWSAGYLISSRRSAPAKDDSVRHTEATPAAPDRRAERQDQQEGKRRASTPGKKRRNTATARRRSRSGPAPIAAAPPAPAAHAPSQQEPTASGSAPEQPSSARQKPRPQPLPPAPTRFLYHLINPDSGDHFVTTDGNLTSQYQARGYEGGAIGRVYTSAVEGTRAISTNHGTAYIFIKSAPKTEPASRVVPLWYSTNNAGDFFYSTNESESKQAGWSASVVGYVRSL